jgi:ABC-2 type transport system ATP-binding protein
VERICHRAAILRRGRIVAIEDVADIKNRSLHILDVAFAAPPPAEAFRLEGVRELRREGNRVRLEVRSNIDSAVKAIARYPVTDLHTEQPSLDDVFLAYYDEEASAREAQDAAS